MSGNTAIGTGKALVPELNGACSSNAVNAGRVGRQVWFRKAPAPERTPESGTKPGWTRYRMSGAVLSGSDRCFAVLSGKAKIAPVPDRNGKACR
ncbi:hypothetical protein [Oxalobacter paraformigenes]|uniref:hypothetical protein n=1 Tax=Oxalobacter paraformigenes TaxID=556268 RepID=UPI0011C77D1C|nr:hypothetical protein [Oxalobacter paraformigenes]